MISLERVTRLGQPDAQGVPMLIQTRDRVFTSQLFGEEIGVAGLEPAT